MSDLVWVAVITGVAGVVGGIVGAIGSPWGKDWVSRREFERTSAREDAARERQASEQAAQKKHQAAERTIEERRAVISDTLRAMSDAMHHYEAAWRGMSHSSYHADTEALKAANVAWSTSRGLTDAAGRDLIDAWKRAFDHADMRYHMGGEPQGRPELQSLYDHAAERLGELLREAGDDSR